MPRCCMRRMRKHQRGKICRVRAAGELGRRIRDMGIVPGTTIQIKERAPLNDPVALRVGSFTLSLRNREADYIEVDVEEE